MCKKWRREEKNEHYIATEFSNCLVKINEIEPIKVELMHRNLKIFQQLVHSVTAMYAAPFQPYCTIFFSRRRNIITTITMKSMKILLLHYKTWVLSLVIIIIIIASSLSSLL